MNFLFLTSRNRQINNSSSLEYFILRKTCDSDVTEAKHKIFLFFLCVTQKYFIKTTKEVLVLT